MKGACLLESDLDDAFLVVALLHRGELLVQNAERRARLVGRCEKGSVEEGEFRVQSGLVRVQGPLDVVGADIETRIGTIGDAFEQVEKLTD
jgi:hypothetical protein